MIYSAGPSPTGVFLTGDPGLEAAGAELGAILGAWAGRRGQRGPGQLPGPRDAEAGGRGQLPQPGFSTAVSSSPKYPADRAGIAKHPPSSQTRINRARPVAGRLEKFLGSEFRHLLQLSARSSGESRT